MPPPRDVWRAEVGTTAVVHGDPTHARPERLRNMAEAEVHYRYSGGGREEVPVEEATDEAES